MNKYQKVFHSSLRLQIACYGDMWSNRHTYRWHRCQLRMIHKPRKYTIDSLRRENKSSRDNLIEQGIISK